MLTLADATSACTWLSQVGYIMLPVRLMLVMASVLLTSFARSAVFDAAVPIWTTAEKGEINSSVAFTSHFEWDGGAPIRLRNQLRREIAFGGWVAVHCVRRRPRPDGTRP